MNYPCIEAGLGLILRLQGHCSTAPVWKGGRGSTRRLRVAFSLLPHTRGGVPRPRVALALLPYTRGGVLRLRVALALLPYTRGGVLRPRVVFALLPCAKDFKKD